MSKRFYQVVDVYATRSRGDFLTLWDLDLGRRWSSRYNADSGYTPRIGDVLLHAVETEGVVTAEYVPPHEIPRRLALAYPINPDKRIDRRAAPRVELLTGMQRVHDDAAPAPSVSSTSSS